MNTTVRIKASEIYKDWHVIDAAGRPLGRVASEAAILLRGKHKPTYEPHLDDGDFVIIINASQVKMTGRKREQNKYYTHSGYPGGLKTRSFEVQMEKFPDRIIEKAVWGMLPGGSLGEAMLKHLKVYKGANHPHQSQITGSERARAARAEGDTTLVWAPPRLRPLTSGLHVNLGFGTAFVAAEVEEPRAAVTVPPPPPAVEEVAPAIEEPEDTTGAEAAEEQE